MLYHVSSISGIKVLHPKKSSHGEAYVYAVSSIVTGLLFGAKHDDFDFQLTEGEGGKPIVYECYPSAFESIYRGKACSVYELHNEGFIEGVTGWRPELVCPRTVAVHREYRIDNLYEMIMKEESEGNIEVHRYSETVEHKKRVSEHIVDRLIRFDAMRRLETDDRFKKHYKKIIEALYCVMDGHLL